LSTRTKTMFVCWTLAGLVIYALYGYRKSPLRTEQGESAYTRRATMRR
jgi:hypothetical protein